MTWQILYRKGLIQRRSIPVEYLQYKVTAKFTIRESKWRHSLFRLWKSADDFNIMLLHNSEYLFTALVETYA